MKFLQSINEYGLKDFVNVVGYVSHNEAIRAQMQSQVLVID